MRMTGNMESLKVPALAVVLAAGAVACSTQSDGRECFLEFCREADQSQSTSGLISETMEHGVINSLYFTDGATVAGGSGRIEIFLDFENSNESPTKMFDYLCQAGEVEAIMPDGTSTAGVAEIDQALNGFSYMCAPDDVLTLDEARLFVGSFEAGSLGTI